MSEPLPASEVPDTPSAPSAKVRDRLRVVCELEHGPCTWEGSARVLDSDGDTVLSLSSTSQSWQYVNNAGTELEAQALIRELVELAFRRTWSGDALIDASSLRVLSYDDSECGWQHARRAWQSPQSLRDALADRFPCSRVDSFREAFAIPDEEIFDFHSVVGRQRVHGTLHRSAAAQPPRHVRRQRARAHATRTKTVYKAMQRLTADEVKAAVSSLQGQRALVRAAEQALQCIREEPDNGNKAAMLTLIQQLNTDIHACISGEEASGCVNTARSTASTATPAEVLAEAHQAIADVATALSSTPVAASAVARTDGAPSHVVLPSGITDWHGAMHYDALACPRVHHRASMVAACSIEHGPCMWEGEAVVTADGDRVLEYSQETCDWAYVSDVGSSSEMQLVARTAIASCLTTIRADCFTSEAAVHAILQHFENNRTRALQDNASIDAAYRTRLKAWAAHQHQPQILSVVDSLSAGKNTPIALHGVSAVTTTGTATYPISASMAMGDTGAGTYLIGMRLFNELAEKGCARRAVRMKSSILSVKGIAGVGFVPFHADIVIELGGHRVHLRDVPVLDGHDGLLLGNDFNGECHANYDFVPRVREGFEYDGRLVLQRVCCDAEGSHLRDEHGDLIVERVSEPIYFSHRTHAPSGKANSIAVEDALETALDAQDPVQINEAAAPLAYCPEVTKVPAWSQSMVRVRLPLAAIEGHDVAILPLNDDRIEDLGVRIAPMLVTPDKDGFCHVRVVNATLHPITLDVLQPIARFVIDPRIADTDLEFTVDEIMDSIHIAADASASDRAEIREMLKTRRRLFASKLGHAHGFQADIHTPQIDSGERPPPYKPNRRCSPQEYEALRTTIDKQVRQKLLVKVHSPYNALPIMIRKPDGTFRCVLDYRNLNMSVMRSSYPLPSVEQNLALIGKANLFSTADLLMGFHQIELNPSSVLKTAFSTPWGQYAYVRLPMGLTSAPGIFQCAVDAALRGLPPGTAIAYMDDVAIPTAGTMKDHMRDVGRVFDRLIEAGFTVRADKVYIGMKEVPYLGFLAGSGGTRPNPERTAAILEITAERMGSDPQQAARFAGMIQFYHRFIPRLHQHLAIFHELKVKGAPAKQLMQSLRFKAAVAVLKHQLANVAHLTRPDFEKPFYVYPRRSCPGGARARHSCNVKMRTIREAFGQ